MPTRFTLTALQLEVGALVAMGSLQAGLLAGALAGRLGPEVLFLLPIAVIATAVCLERIALAPCLVVLVLPVGLVALPGGVEAVQVVAAGVVGLVLVRRAAGGAPLRLPPVLLLGVAVVALALVSTAGAADLGAAVRQDVSLVLSLLLVCAVVSACSSPADVRRVATLLVVVGAGICVVGLQGISSLQAVNRGQTVDNRARGTFTEPNQFGIFCAIVLLVSLGLLLGARSPRQRWLAGLSGLAAAGALAFALSRGGWIGATLGVAVLVLLLPEARGRLLLLAMPVVLLGLGIVLLQPDRPEVQVVRDRVATFGDVNGNPYDDRPAIWAEGRRQVLDRPLLGQGPGQYPYVALRAAETATVAPYHAHNVLLNVAAELGLVAAALVVAFTLRVLVLARRTVARLTDSGERALAAGLAGSLATVVGQGLVDFTLRNAVIISLLSLLLGLLLAMGQLPSARPAPTHAPRHAVGT